MAPHCKHVIVSDFMPDCDEYQSCKSDSMEDIIILIKTELDQQSDDDIEQDL